MKIKLTGTALIIDGKRIEDGGEADVSTAEANALIERGLAEKVGKPKKVQRKEADEKA